MSDKPFSPEELRQIESAVRRAEAGGGEIVVYLTQSSDEYHLAAWKGAALGALGGALVAALGYAMLDAWDLWLEVWLVAPAALGGALGYLVGGVCGACRRALIDEDLLEERVKRRAAEVFLGEEVFATPGRDGVLLFLSQFERRVAIFADSGARARAPQAKWDGITRDLSEQIRAGEALRGLLKAIDSCGALLGGETPTGRTDEGNLLEDRPRVEGEER
jgi:uncharacterized membrane protein